MEEKKKMKRYLNKEERITLLYLLNLVDRLENMVIDWYERGNLTKLERKALKMSFTWGLKAVESIVNRLEKTTLLNLEAEKQKSAIRLDLRHSTEMISKIKSTKLQDGYEANKEYFKLVELILDKNCNGCTIDCEKCEFFKEFIEQCIPYLDGDKTKENCKYSM